MIRNLNDLGRKTFRTGIEKEIADFRAEAEKEFNDIRGTLKLHNWMLTTTIAMSIALLFKVFSL